MIEPERPAEPVRASWSSEFPIADRKAVEVVFKQLIRRIVEQLGSRRQGYAGPLKENHNEKLVDNNLLYTEFCSAYGVGRMYQQ